MATRCIYIRLYNVTVLIYVRNHLRFRSLRSLMNVKLYMSHILSKIHVPYINAHSLPVGFANNSFPASNNRFKLTWPQWRFKAMTAKISTFGEANLKNASDKVSMFRHAWFGPYSQLKKTLSLSSSAARSGAQNSREVTCSSYLKKTKGGNI
jgi:hypothetical protein